MLKWYFMYRLNKIYYQINFFQYFKMCLLENLEFHQRLMILFFRAALAQ